MNKFGIIFLLFTVSIISSCDTVEEIFLFDKNDPEYAELLAMQAAKCVSDAKIFDALDESKDFLNSGELNRIYKISQDTQNLREVFVKITNVTATV
jgi:tRNA C32,U32 (ribose-2'-O)-methylase TrmJ